MPELPEVETVRRDLERCIRGRIIEKVEVLFPGSVQGMAPGLFSRQTDRRVRAPREIPVAASGFGTGGGGASEDDRGAAAPAAK